MELEYSDEDIKNKVIEMSFKKELKINDKLPKIYLPKNKIKTFINWYNKDLRFIDDIPQAFKEGYFILENDFMINSKDYLRDLIKKVFREVKEEDPTQEWYLYKARLDYQVENSDIIIMYFRFLENNKIDVVFYLSEGSKLMDAEYSYNTPEGKEEEEFLKDDGQYIKGVRNHLNEPIEENWYEKPSYPEYISELIRILAQLFGCTMWYLSTSTNTTKYIYNQADKIEPLERIVRNPQRIKTKSTPIYDMTKIKEVRVDSLIKRRKGWTYSHSFQVHGHYRHYKNGKTVFVKSYIKGKDKDFQQQNIIINPKD